jgi:hypothetical protein
VAKEDPDTNMPLVDLVQGGAQKVRVTNMERRNSCDAKSLVLSEFEQLFDRFKASRVTRREQLVEIVQYCLELNTVCCLICPVVTQNSLGKGINEIHLSKRTALRSTASYEVLMPMILNL